MTVIRMSRWVSRPEMDAESLRLWTDGVLDVWRAQAGLIQVHLLAREGSEERMTFSVWATARDYETFAAGIALRDVAAAFDEIYAENGRPSPTVWSVLTDDWPVTAR